MERKNAKSSIYLRYNNKYKSSKVKQAWGPSCAHDDHDHDHDDDGCDDHHDGFYYHDHHHGDGGMMMMMAWPPRSYTCSFCKREFRSAQALGGHMNVHRRDRAQLRQLSQQISPTNLSPNSPLHLNLNLPPHPNYNPNNLIHSSPLPRPSNPAQKIQPPASRLVARSHPPTHDIITRKQFECFRKKNDLVGLRRQEYNHDDVGLKKGGGGGGGIIRLDLEMNGKEDLDLELRLGYK